MNDLEQLMRTRLRAADTVDVPIDAPQVVTAARAAGRRRVAWRLGAGLVALVAVALVVAQLWQSGFGRTQQAVPLPLNSPSTATASTTPSPTPVATPAVTPSSVPTASTGSSAPTVGPGASAIGAWTPTCTSASADAAALVANLTGTAPYNVARPSSVAGFSDAAAAAVKPLLSCPAVHVLAVSPKVSVGSDLAATQGVWAAISAGLRTVPLTLSGSKVGRFSFGSTALADAMPVLVAVLGEAKTSTASCAPSGQSWTQLTWGGLTVSFDATKPGQPIESWRLVASKTSPTNLEAPALGFTPTMAEIKKANPAAVQTDMFGNGVAPYVTEASSGLFYLWDADRTGRATQASGGAVHACE